jgi:hypothetical protein
LAYLSKALRPKSRGLSTYEKEYMTILTVVQHWSPYLQQAEFHILTGHKSLSQLNEQRLHTNWQHKVFSKLLGLQYKVIYKKGVKNRVADALSRRAHDASELCLISTHAPQWMQYVQQSYSSDLAAQKLLTKLSVNSEAVPNFVLKDGLLRFKSRLWVGQDKELQKQIIAALHDSPIGGHLGIPVTYRRVKQMFAWKGLKIDVQQFVKGCQICLQAKRDRVGYPGRLQSLQVPSEAWETISMDFI